MGYQWHWDRLPEHEHERVIDRFESRDAGALMVIHNDYRMSDELYCCSVQHDMVLNWFKYGIDNGYIKRQVDQNVL